MSGSTSLFNRGRSFSIHPATWAIGPAILAGLGLFVWIVRADGGIYLDRLLEGNRAAVYSAVTSVSGALLGFSITTISIVLSVAGNERMRLISHQPAYKRLWHVFEASIWALGLSTLASLAALVFDRDKTPHHWMLIAASAAGLFALISVGQCVWALQRVIRAVSNENNHVRPSSS